MRPTNFSESVAIATLPAYEQFSVESRFTLDSCKRHKTGVAMSQVQTPSNFGKAIICNRPVTTSKRFISRLDLSPKLRPRKFYQTMFMFPKNPEHSYTATVLHHVEGKRKWYTSKVDLEPTVTCRLTPSRHELDIDEKTGRIYRSEWRPPQSNGTVMNGDLDYTDSSQLNGSLHGDLRSFHQGTGRYGFFDQGQDLDDEVSI